MPVLDALESRITPSTFTPTTTSDLTTLNQSTLLASDVNSLGQIISRGDAITLRSAVIAADNTAGPNTINLGLSALTYRLTIAPSAGTNGPGDATSGDLAVTSALTISGAGSASTVVEAGTTASNGISKVFSFNPLGNLNGFAVSLTGLTVEFGKNNSTDNNGDGEGGAFDFDAGPDGLGSLTMNDVVIANSSTTNGDGGGIALFDGGIVSITNSTITNNTANGNLGSGTGGGIYIGFSGAAETGNTKLTISGSTISGNKTAGTTGGDGGGILSFANFPVAIHATTVAGNKTGMTQADNGGGIADEGSVSLTIDQGSVISGNSASSWGGGIYSADTTNITDVAIINNSASGGLGSTGIEEGGGGIFADENTANVTVTNSRIVDNTATVGGSQLDGDGANVRGGVLNAANNWFGTNTLAGSFFGSGVKTLTTTPFLKMTFAAVPASLVSGGTSVLTASVTTNSTGGTGFSIPPTPATFSGGTIGSVNPSSTTTSAGSATSTFTAGGTPGMGNVSATIDHQTLTTQLTVTAGTPTANPQSVTVAFNTATAITLTGSDPDNPPLSLTYHVATNPTHGALSGTAPSLTYTPSAGFHGSDSFTFTVNNGTNSSSPATISIKVAPGVPTANPQTVSVAQNTATAITLTGTDPDVPPLTLTYAVGTNPTHGALSGTAPNLTYTPNTGYHGPDSFTFTVNNGTNTSAAATVTLNVATGMPTANPQTVGVAFNTATTITLTGSDPNVPPLSLTYHVATTPAHGALSGTAPNLTYTPTTGFHGSDSFTFTVNNGSITSAPATVTLNVATGVPTANPQTLALNENTPLNVTLTGSDPDVPALPLTYAIVAGHGPSHGAISGFNAATGALTYTPSSNYVGPDSFQFTVINGTNTSAPATVSLTVSSTVATVSSTVGVSWGTAGTATLSTVGAQLLPTGRTNDVPWYGINRLTITLSQAEPLAPANVSVTGINVANYGPVTISGSGTTYTITLAKPINTADRIILTIGSANIATFTRGLAVLPGDFNDDGTVTVQDAVLIRNEYLGIAGAVPTIYGDIDGNGVVDVNDYNLARSFIGKKLP